MGSLQARITYLNNEKTNTSAQCHSISVARRDNLVEALTLTIFLGNEFWRNCANHTLCIPERPGNCNTSKACGFIAP